MILSAIDWLSISINLLLVLFVVVCLLMSLIILMQRPKNEGLGAAFGSNTTDQLFGARTTNVLQKGTVYLASLFFILTLTLAVLIGKKNSGRLSLQAAVTPPAPVVEEKPASIAGETPVKVDEKPLEPEAVTPPVQVPPPGPTPTTEPLPEGTPPPSADEPKPEGTPTEEEEEPKPTEEEKPE